MSRWRKGKAVSGTGADVLKEIVDVQRYLYGDQHVAEAIPRAGLPPRLTPDDWRRSCVHRDLKCGQCAICRWETEANRWHDWSPWRESMELRPATTRPGFGNLDAALLAWWEWEQHGRAAPSATGALLDLINEGATFSGPRQAKRDNALLRRADGIIHIELAIVDAFRASELDVSVCRALLIARTHGVLDKTPSYPDLAEVAGLPVEAVKRCVKTARRALQVELSARGLVPMPARTSGLHWDIDVRRRQLLKG